jgi:hypothetical protein
MAMLEMLMEMVCPVELDRLVAFTELVNINQMFSSAVPISGEIAELFATVTADVGIGRGAMGGLRVG